MKSGGVVIDLQIIQHKRFSMSSKTPYHRRARNMVTPCLIFLPCFVSSSYSSSNECYTYSCRPDNALCIDGIYLHSFDDDAKKCPDNNQSKDDIIFFVELEKRKQSSHYNHKNCPKNICHSSHSSSDRDKSRTYVCYNCHTDPS